MNRGRGRGRGRGGRHNFRPHRNPTEKPDQPTELEVGITEYLSDLKGFSGVIKARYSDFHVSEIDLDGEVAKITDTKFPEEFVQRKAPELPEQSTIEEIGQDMWERLTSKEAGEKERIDVTEYDKERRTELHRRIKDVFRERIVCSTVTEGDKKFIELKKFCKDTDRRKEWPSDLPEYVHFVLYKESLDTMEAIMKIADLTRVPASAFNYAGVKDRRAKTSQWISVRKVEPFKLLVKTRPLRSVRVGNLAFKDEPLKLGQLKGNQFRIALRNVMADEGVIEEAMRTLREKGFINYYGLQRFGSDREAPTHEIGVRLMQGKWKEACELILKPKKGEDPSADITIAKKLYQETGDAKKACEKLGPHSNSLIETKLLQGLAASGKNDYVNALENIPRNTRLLYIHSLQSLIWNKAVSKRIREFGQKPIVGDFVLINKTEETVDETTNTETSPGLETDKTEASPELETDKTEASPDIETDKTEPTKLVKALTLDDLANYTIYDVVLPLPGYDVLYPDNSMRDFYKEELESYGLSLEMEKQSVKTYTLSGTYRKIVRKVEDLSWSCLKYNDPNGTLLRSSFEEFLGHKEPENVEDGKYKALLVTFSLRSSSYATMVLREILKIDTSHQTSMKLSNYHLTAPNKLPSEEPMATNNSLLHDEDKFAAFKRAVFDDDEGSKRKSEHEENGPSKRAKSNDE